MNRYQQLLDICRERKPQVILEIGTWSGQRALELLQIVPTAKYIGFDLFEEATDETDAAELNVKAHYGANAVARLLKGHDVSLIKGNTRETLPEFIKSTPNLAAVDLAFIDGGHSLSTIRSDWHHVRQIMSDIGVVVLDDYYNPEIDGFGCNQLVKTLPHELLPVKDPMVTGSKVQMVKIEVKNV